MRALRETNQDKQRAASLLEITVKVLETKLAQYGLSPKHRGGPHA